MGGALPPQLPARRSKELFLFGFRGRLEQPPRSTTEVAKVDSAALRLPDEPLRQVECLVDDRRAADLVMAHVVQDRPLGPRCDDRIRHALDPDARPPAVTAVTLAEWLERIDLVGPRVLAEAEEDH